VPQLTRVQYPVGGCEANGEPEAKLAMSGKQSAYFISGRALVTVATPTAAPAADQPTTPSGSLGHPALALPAPHPLARISDTTNTRRL
jgi:hypothetical protein